MIGAFVCDKREMMSNEIFSDKLYTEIFFRQNVSNCGAGVFSFLLRKLYKYCKKINHQLMNGFFYVDEDLTGYCSFCHILCIQMNLPAKFPKETQINLISPSF